jgi:phenylacetate-CoA ligase
MNFQYWNPEIEKMPRSDLEALQLQKLKDEIACALRTPFYQKRLASVGINSPEDIKSLADLKRIPFTTKHDLREGFPYGFLSIPKDEVIRLHASSGTTGIPTTIYFNRDDLKR